MSREGRPDFEKSGGLLPAVVQERLTGMVLMVGYMNEEAWERTRRSGRVTFFSRSRNELWEKGETSGNGLRVISMVLDCDSDAILVRAAPEGPTCHTGEESCFGSATGGFLSELEELIEQRNRERPEGSYTTELLEAGRGRIAQKVGEEGLEVALAGVSGEREQIIAESADLIYHLLVLLADGGLTIREVLDELRRRHEA